MNTSRDELLGHRVLGRYRIVKRIARGGMGVLYLARSEGAAGFSRPVVVKRILPDLTGDDSMTQMFVREARILSYIKHPGIVGVIDFAQEDSAYIMVLDYVHGFHLGRWLKYVRETDGHFPVDVALHVVIRTLEALNYAHELKRPDGKSLCIVHRDISPSNILVDVEGHVKLCDFGIARVMGETAMYKTEDTTVKGKFPYLAPELFNGQQPSAQSDVYACGLVLHELLTGKNEFRGRDMAETLHRVFTKSPSLVSEVRDDVDQAIDGIIRKSLAKTVQGRYASAADMAHALRELRSTSDTEADAQLYKRVQADFLGNLPKVLRIEPLSVLDAAWRGEEGQEWQSEPPDSAERPSLPTGSDLRTGRLAELGQPPEALLRRDEATQVATGGRSDSLRFAIVALSALVVALGVGGTAAWHFLGQAPAEAKAPAQADGARRAEQQALENRRTEEALLAAAQAAKLAAEEAARQPTARSAKPKGKAPQRPRRAVNKPPSTKNKASALSAALSARKGELTACFNRHPGDTEGISSVKIKFSVAASGSVSRASVSPASVSGSALGSCLIKVAKSIKFPAQDQPLTFSIPIKTRVAGR